MTARVAVLMPVHNGERYLDEAIASIVGQTECGFRLRILDDGSTDRTAAILENWARRDGRIEVRRQVNGGIVSALNALLETVEEPYVARMDADDVAAPQRLQDQLAELERNGRAVGVGSWVQLFGADGEGAVWHYRDNPVDTRVVSLLGNTCLCHPSLMVRTEALRRYRYRSEYESMEDMDLLCRLLAGDEGELYALPEVLLRYRVHPASVCHRQRERQHRLRLDILSTYYRESLDLALNRDDERALGVFLRQNPPLEREVDRVQDVFARVALRLGALRARFEAEAGRRVDSWRQLKCEQDRVAITQ